MLERSPLNCLDVAQVKFLKHLTIATTSQAGAADQISRAIYNSWKRKDAFATFRFDWDEYRRHAYRHQAPTKDNKARVEAGANRLAAFGLAVMQGRCR